MPSLLKCKSCGEKYYTARSRNKINEEIKCEECGSKLKIIESEGGDGKKENHDFQTELSDSF